MYYVLTTIKVYLCVKCRYGIMYSMRNVWQNAANRGIWYCVIMRHTLVWSRFLAATDKHFSMDSIVNPWQTNASLWIVCFWMVIFLGCLNLYTFWKMTRYRIWFTSEWQAEKDFVIIIFLSRLAILPVGKRRYKAWCRIKGREGVWQHHSWQWSKKTYLEDILSMKLVFKRL